MVTSIVVVVWLTGVSAARAQGTPPPTPAPPATAPASPELRAQAQAHFQAGVQAYNVGDFDTAIVEWKEAYRLLHLPDFLFNIGQAYRGKRDHENAIFFFNAYLRERPDAPNTAEVTALRDEEQRLREEERAAETERAAAAQREQEAASRAAVEAASKPVGTASVDAGDDNGPAPGRRLRIAGLVAGGTGLLLLGTGALFSVSASDTASDLEAAAERGDPWSDELADMESSGERKATMGAVFMGVGAAAVVGGGVAFFLGWRKGREPAAVAIAPTGTGVVAVMRF